MYPVSLGFVEAERRIRELIKNGHHAEALITSVFSFEKTLKRALRCCAIRRGFTSKQADTLFKNKGFNDLKEIWTCYSPDYRPLHEFIDPVKWQHVPPAVTMRNKLAHGERVYKLTDCEISANQVLDALIDFRNKLLTEIKFDGWARVPTRRNPALQWLS